MRLPKQKIIFTWIPLETVPSGGWPTPIFPTSGLKKVIAVDWDRLIPGHPGPDGRQIGTKTDARAALSYLQDLSAAVTGGGRSQMPGPGHARDQIAKIREVGELRRVLADEYRALLRFLQPWNLSQSHGISEAWITSATPSPPTERMARSTSSSPKRWVVINSSGKRLEASCAKASSQAL